MKTILIALMLGSAAFLHAKGLNFPQKLREIHAPSDVDKVTADFEFSNLGDKPVSVVKYDAACSCMSVTIKEGKLRYAPGESGMIRAVFEMGNFTGTVDKVVALWLDDDPPEKPSVTLTVRVHIPVLVAVEPKTLKWEVNGEAAPQSIRVTMNDAKPVRVTQVVASNAVFKTELKTLEEGKLYEISIQPSAIDKAAMGVFRIETDSPNPKHRVQQAFAVIRNPTAGEAAVRK